jgi:hypothetical protein
MAGSGIDLSKNAVKAHPMGEMHHLSVRDFFVISGTGGFQIQVVILAYRGFSKQADFIASHDFFIDLVFLMVDVDEEFLVLVMVPMLVVLVFMVPMFVIVVFLLIAFLLVHSSVS